MTKWHSDFDLVAGEENKRQVVKLMDDALALVKAGEPVIPNVVRRAATSAWRLGWESFAHIATTTADSPSDWRAKVDTLERDLMTALEQKDKLAAEMEEWKKVFRATCRLLEHR